MDFLTPHGTAITESNYLNSPVLRSYLQQRLLWDRNGSMPRSLVDQVLLDGNIRNTQYYRDFLAIIWRSLCKEHDICPWHSGSSKLFILSILWAAIKRHAKAAGLVESTDEDGRIQLREFGLNWKEASKIAESIAPPYCAQPFSRGSACGSLLKSEAPSSTRKSCCDRTGIS